MAGGFPRFMVSLGSAAGGALNSYNAERQQQLSQRLGQQQTQLNDLELQRQQALVQFAQAKGMNPDQTALFIANPQEYFQQAQDQRARIATASAYNNMAAQETDPKKRHAWEMAAIAAVGGAQKDDIQNLLKSANVLESDALAAERYAKAEMDQSIAAQTGKITGLLPGGNVSAPAGSVPPGALLPVAGEPNLYVNPSTGKIIRLEP